MKVLSTEEELSDAKRRADAHLPKSTFIHLWLHINLTHPKGKGTSDNWKCYVDKWPDPNLIIGMDIATYEKKMGLLCMYANVPLEDSQIVEQFLVKATVDSGITEIGTVRLKPLHKEWLSVCQKVFSGHFGWRLSQLDDCVSIYWVDESKRRELIQRVIQAPDGFQFDILNSSDAEYVASVWPHRFPGCEKYIERQILHFPSVCLRETGADKKLACFVFVHAVGTEGNLYTVPEFRRRGLASLVEQRLIQILTERNHLPVKSVVHSNAEGSEFAKTSSLWSYVGEVVWLLYDSDNLTSG